MNETENEGESVKECDKRRSESGEERERRRGKERDKQMERERWMR